MAAKNVTSTAAKPTKPTKPTEAPAPSPVPTATPDTASITEDAKSSVVSGNVLANDSSGLTVASVRGQDVTSTTSISGTYGTLTIDGTGKWTYTLNNGDARVQALDENGTLAETFNYIATGNGSPAPIAESLLTVTIKGTNDAPVAQDDTGTVAQGGKVTLDVLANDTDVDSPLMTITAVKVPGAQGTAKIVDGKVEFTAAKGFTGEATITYTVSDGKLSAQGKASVTVTSVNQAPVAQDGKASGQEDAAAITGSVKASDADKDTLTYSVVQGPTVEQGKLTFNQDGSYSFVPAKDYNGEVTFTYKANDGKVDSNTATVTITVVAMDEPNTAPMATGGDASGAEDTTITGQVGGTDAEGSPLTYKLVAPVDGLTFNQDGSYSYTPAKDFNGPVTFEYVAHDGILDSASKTVTITVTPLDEPNTAPVAEAGTASGQEDATEITGKVTATDADGDNLTYAIHGDKPAGLTFNEDGSYSFVPAKDFAGEVRFQFVANDGKVNSAPQTVTLTVVDVPEAPVNTAPVAKDGTAEGQEDGGAISGTVTATDADNNTLTYSVVQGPTAEQGELIFSKDGSYSFTPAANFAGPVEFTYKANDGTADSNEATVTITVADVPEAPVNTAPVVASIADANASEAAGSISIPVTLSGPASQDVTLTYEVSTPGRTISFDDTGAIHSAIPAGYGGVRWTGVSSSGDGAALTATTGGGQIQAITPGELSLTSLTVSTASTNQVVTIEAIRGGVVVGSQQITLGNGGPQTAAVTLGPNFSGIDAVRIDGSADSYGNDYPIKIDNVVLGGSQPTTGTITIPVGSDSGSINIPVVNDSAYEVGETISVRLTGATGATLGTKVEATGTIINDDAEPVGANAPLPVVTILANSQLYGDVREGQGGVQEFEITRDARLDQELTVSFESDIFGPFTATFRPGESKTWATVAIPEDDKVNPSTYEIKLAASENYLPGAVTGVSGRFIDNDGAPVNTAPKAWASNTGTSESMFAQYGGYYSLGAYGEDAETPNVELTYTLVSQQPEFGTISQDPDYGGLRFKPTQEFLDSIYKGKDATFSYDFTVSDGQYTTDVKTATFTVYGEGNPAGFVPEISITGPTEVTEGGMASYVFTRTGATNSELRVPVTVTGTADGTDYTAYQTTAYFGWNSSTAVININATDDKAVETTETLVVTAGSGSGHTVSPTAGSVTTNLLDNDTVTPPVGAPGSPPKTPGLTVTPSGTGTVVAEDGKLTDTFTVVLNTAPTSDVHVYIDSSTYEATVIPGYLTFGPTNWHMPQTVTVKAYAEGEPGGTDSLMIYGWSDEDPDYGWVSAPDLPVTVLETAPAVVEPPIEEPPVEEPGGETPGGTPPKPGLTVTPSGTGTVVTEDGKLTDTFTVKLNTRPVSDVYVDLYPTTGEAELDRYFLHFTPDTWSTPQTVTVKGWPDGLDEPLGSTDSIMIYSYSDEDPDYNWVSAPDLPVTILDTAPAAEQPPVEGPPVEEPGGETPPPAPVTTIALTTLTGLDENSTLSWNAVTGAASYVMVATEADAPGVDPHELGYVLAPNTSFAINGNDEFVGMLVHVEARDANGAAIARTTIPTEIIANINDDPTGRPVISDNTPEVGQLLTISPGDLADADRVRTDRPDEFGYRWERSTDDGATWEQVSTTDSYRVTEEDGEAGAIFRGAAVYTDGGETVETVYSLVTAKVNDPNPDTPPVAFDDPDVETPMGAPVTIDVRANDFDFEGHAITVASHGQGRNGTVALQPDGTLVYTPNANFVGEDTFDYTLNGGDTATVTVMVTQTAGPLTLLTVDNLDENSILSWTAVPGADSYALIGTEPDDPTAPPHELAFIVAPNTSFNIAGNDEFAGMAIKVEARAGNVVITRSVNQTSAIENINDAPTGNLAIDDTTPEVGQRLTLTVGTFEDGDGYRDRGREEEWQWAWERSKDGTTWETIITGVSPEDGPYEMSYTVTQADYGHFLRGRAIYEDRAGDTIETVYSLPTSKIGATPATGGGTGGETGGETGGGDQPTVDYGAVTIKRTGDSTTVTEGGDTDTFTVELADEPTADVIVQISTGNSLLVDTYELTFTPGNWNIPQTITVGAENDYQVQSERTDVVSFYTMSDDLRYADLMPTDLPVTIIDAPRERVVPEVTVANLGVASVTEGSSATFTFHRSEADGDLAIDAALTGLDPADIASVTWNNTPGGIAGFRGLSQWATMTVVFADDATPEATERLQVEVLESQTYLFGDPNIAFVDVLDNDVAPANTKPVVESKTVDLTENQMTATIKPVITDADGNPTTIKVVGTLPTYVTFDEGNQQFLFNGEASAFDHLNEGQTEAITFQYVANDGTVDSDQGQITINITGITDPVAPQIDPEPAQFADPYNYDQGNGGALGRSTTGDDILNGGTGQDTIQGFGGNDTIYGKEGNDSLIGGNGNDTVHGGSGDDIINGDGGGTGPANVGVPGADLLYGGDGSDTINGQDGNDIIVGGHGADNLTGGLGDDTFVFLDIFDRGDTIMMQGQGAANDVFDFRNFDFSPNEIGLQGPVNGLQVLNQAPVEGQMLEDTFYYNSVTGRLSLNTGKDGLEDFYVTLLVGGTANPTPLPRLNSDDILV